ncbi:hypothetical protein Ngar_c03430 [Candidatus Nitrososphaera gargensis Ga9.2]|uniref:Uncharacterized protein n=1 Tax=Nitrososphaera gargensis (strain Ga9.2) TaxID=1237085 RepID=K0I7Q9_NITGG|nr:hypothetical protein [Candidatus Nitrososphaera gargensis]AFU57261.1 hypothetical protein Ngar_c03130 [Candidatus Nitrososphaera gargensis Ga9.2]AFU57291.1 hypothetical protein Ngar_c03430 [Candidatus Nitrososphaera gargensis Ga9.2]
MGEYTSATISVKRYNGLKQAAEREGRSITGQLDWILKNAGVPEIDNEQTQTVRVDRRKA